MKAITVEQAGGPEQLKLLKLPIPEPAPEEVLVRVKAAGVNLVDTLFRQGYLVEQWPVVMGSDFSGVIEGLGSAVSGFDIGQEVYGYKRLGNGTYAEYVAVPAAYVAPKPVTLSHIEAASLPCVGLTAYQVVIDTLNIGQGETLVITGAAGGVGSVAVQLAADRGAYVIGTASAHNESYVLGLGARVCVDYRNDDWVGVIKALFPQGVDAVFTCVGGDTKRCSPHLIRDGGRMVWISGNEPEGPPMQRMISGTLVHGMPYRETLQAVSQLIDAGRLRTHVEQVYPLTEAAAAQIRVAEGHVRGKLVIEI